LSALDGVVDRPLALVPSHLQFASHFQGLPALLLLNRNWLLSWLAIDVSSINLVGYSGGEDVTSAADAREGYLASYPPVENRSSFCPYSGFSHRWCEPGVFPVTECHPLSGAVLLFRAIDRYGQFGRQSV